MRDLSSYPPHHSNVKNQPRLGGINGGSKELGISGEAPLGRSHTRDFRGCTPLPADRVRPSKCVQKVVMKVSRSALKQVPDQIEVEMMLPQIFAGEEGKGMTSPPSTCT